MKCPDCGITVEKADRFCPKCYARIEPPGLWRRLLSFFQNVTKPGPHVVSIKKTVTIKTVDKDGASHEYHTLAEAPLELQKAVEKLEAEGVMKKEINSLSSEALTDASKAPQPGIVIRNKVSIYRIKDA